VNGRSPTGAAKMLADNGVPPDLIALHLLDAHRCGDAAVIAGPACGGRRRLRPRRSRDRSNVFAARAGRAAGKVNVANWARSALSSQPK
jgi:hypothetical protein